MEVWFAIVGAGVATYAVRALPLVVNVPLPEAGPLRRYLDALPTSILAALSGAAIFAPGQRLVVGPEIAAALVVIALTAWRRNLIVAVIAGVVTTALLRSL